MSRDLRSFEIRFGFELAVPNRLESDGPIRKFSNRPCLPIARRSQTTRTINGAPLSGTVYRLASCMSDHTPVLLNVFEDWNEGSVVLNISFVSFVDYSTPDSIRIRLVAGNGD